MFGARAGQLLNPQPDVASPEPQEEFFEFSFDDAEFFLSGQGLRMTKTGSDAWALSFDAVPQSSNVEVLARFSIGALAEESYGVVVRGSGSLGSETGHAYWINMAFSEGTEGTFHAVIDDGSVNTEALFGLPASAGARVFVRFQAIGSSVRGRSWLDGSPEPSSWEFERDQGDVDAAGWVGLFMRESNGGNRYCDFFSAGVDGEPAPMPEQEPQTGQYRTDFAGGSPLDQWTTRWASADTVVIEATATDILPLGWNRNINYEIETTVGVSDGRLEIVPGSGQDNHFYPIEPPADVEDAEVLMRFRAPDSGGSPEAARAEVVMRDDPDVFRSYFAGIDHRSGIQDPTKMRLVVPLSETIATEEYTAFDWQMDAIWYLRGRIEGYSVKLRAWPASEDEPTVWHFEATDSQERYDAGRFGLSGRAADGSPILQVDYYALDTGANTIPIPD